MTREVEKMRSNVLLAVAFGSALAVCGSTSASPIPWTQDNGSTTYYDYSNGQSTNGLFGDPLVLDGSFLFFPSNFKAVATNGAATSVSDTLSFDVAVKPNYSVTAISIKELGDYQITGTGTANIGGTLQVTNLVNPGNTIVNLATTPSMPVTTPGSGEWSAEATATNLPNGWTLFHVNLSNILHATAGANSAVNIEKKFAQGAIEVSIIVPEPASIGLVATGISAMLLRRRRSN